MKMLQYYLCFYFLVIHFRLTLQIPIRQSTNYTAAVVQYNPVTDAPSGKDILASNVQEYVKIIEAADNYNVDLIVFPEYGLTNFPNLKVIENFYNSSADYKLNKIVDDNVKIRKYFYSISSVISVHPTIIPCLDTSLALQSIKDISCAAMKHKMYIVINHYERVNCQKRESNCQPDGFLLYNTNIVFGRNGSIIAKYRKRELYDEPWADPGDPVQESSFCTDFNVSFDQLIGTDILCHKPKIIGIPFTHFTKDYVYSTRKFYDGLALASSVQNQAAWAYNNNVNLLAAGFSNDGGSGIYIGDLGPLDNYELDRSTNLMIIAKVPKRIHLDDYQSKSSHYIIHKLEETRENPPFNVDDWIRNYLIEHNSSIRKMPVESKMQEQVTKLCSSNFCCEFVVKINFDVKIGIQPDAVFYRYWLIKFEAGYQLGSDLDKKIEMCAVIACPGEEFNECGKTYPNNITVDHPTIFENLRITRLVRQDTKDFFHPFTTREDNFLLIHEDFDFVSSEYQNVNVWELSIKRNINDLMVFGINGQRAPKVEDVAMLIKPQQKLKRRLKPRLISGLFSHTALIVYLILFSLMLFSGIAYYYTNYYQVKRTRLRSERFFVNYYSSRIPPGEGPPPYCEISRM